MPVPLLIRRRFPPVLVPLLVLPALLPGCRVGPDYIPPEPSVPDAWHQELTEGLAEGDTGIHSWWEIFGDPLLESLIVRASRDNLDVRQSFARIAESRAFRRIAGGDRFPDVDGVGDANRSRISEGVIPGSFNLPNRTDNSYLIGVDATWEIDLWGRISRSIEAAEADLQASIEDYRDILVLLYAEVALTYIDVRTLQARLRFARSNAEAQAGTLQLTRDRFEADLVGELDVRQAELNLAQTESIIPALESSLGQGVHRLSVLLGEHPGALYEELTAESNIPEPPEVISVGVPLDLVRQRPDIRRAERSLAAQTARIGVATADLYPRFSLLGSFAFQSRQGSFSGIFNSDNRAWSFGPAVRWNLFDGGRVRGNIQSQEALTEQALIDYERTVLFALEDVENAALGFTRESRRMEDLQRAVTAAERSVDLVTTLYRTGLTDFQNVLDTQRSLFQLQDDLAASEGVRVQNLVRLYRALGGGWDPGELESTEAAETEADAPDGDSAPSSG